MGLSTESAVMSRSVLDELHNEKNERKRSYVIMFMC